MSVNRLISSLNNVLSTSRSAAQSQQRSRRRRQRRRARRARAAVRSSSVVFRNGIMPGAFTNSTRSRFRVTNVAENTVRVTGSDLVYAVPAELAEASSTSGVFCVIPANPAYWTGTRIGQLAGTYAQYRPISLRFNYIPQVAVTTPGILVMGTLWNQGIPSSDIQQTLQTSNGGLTGQVYLPQVTDIKLGNNLPQNLFNMSGDLTWDTCPFYFMALARGASNDGGSTSLVPGYFFVEYSYDLKNPIGSSWNYANMGLVQASSEYSGYNVSAVLADEIEGPPALGIGSVLNREGTTWYHSEQEVANIASTYVWMFGCNQAATAVASLTYALTTVQAELGEADSKIDTLLSFKYSGEAVASVEQAIAVQCKPLGAGGSFQPPISVWLEAPASASQAPDFTFTASYNNNQSDASPMVDNMLRSGVYLAGAKLSSGQSVLTGFIYTGSSMVDDVSVFPSALNTSGMKYWIADSNSGGKVVADLLSGAISTSVFYIGYADTIVVVPVTTTDEDSGYSCPVVMS